MAYFVLFYADKLKEVILSAKNKDFAIIVPYMKQRKEYIQTIMASGSPYAGMVIATTNSFQALERAFVFVDLTTAENLGGKVGFVADRHQLSFTFTRQTQPLTVYEDQE
jgi:superfamily I DNA and/or RNA helicase